MYYNKISVLCQYNTGIFVFSSSNFENGVAKYSKILIYVLGCSVKCRYQFGGRIGRLSINTYILFNYSSEIIDDTFYFHITATEVGL